MPFQTRILYTGTNGTRTVTVSKVKHIRGQFSGPQRPTDTYFSVTGEDKTTPRFVYLPPGTETKAEAMHLAMQYLLKPVLS